jgi:hypothetical protein
MISLKYDYYLVENTNVSRYDRETREAEQLKPDGTWINSMRTLEICNGRPLQDEKDALETASFPRRSGQKAGGREAPRFLRMELPGHSSLVCRCRNLVSFVRGLYH